jgi:hypothetical protein
MGAGDDHWSVRFPGLFKDQYADYAHCRLRFTTAAVPEELVSRLHLVAVTPAAEVIVCQATKAGDSSPEAPANQANRFLSWPAASSSKRQAPSWAARRGTSPPT